MDEIKKFALATFIGILALWQLSKWFALRHQSRVSAIGAARYQTTGRRHLVSGIFCAALAVAIVVVE